MPYTPSSSSQPHNAGSSWLFVVSAMVVICWGLIIWYLHDPLEESAREIEQNDVEGVVSTHALTLQNATRETDDTGSTPQG
jgi:hypothetical protein